LAKVKGAKRALLLPVSAPFHCALMEPAAFSLGEVLAALTVSPPSIPVVSNVEALPNQDASRIVELLVKQVCAPVRWTDSVVCMEQLGVRQFIELGPGRVLSGLIKRIARMAEVSNVEDRAGCQGL
jgi:[acyl-carrier-protein] S-malonyltransferase